MSTQACLAAWLRLYANIANFDVLPSDVVVRILEFPLPCPNQSHHLRIKKDAI
jgi:hypothetical protein